MTELSRRDFFKLIATSTLSLGYTGINNEEANACRKLWHKRYDCDVYDYLSQHYSSVEEITDGISTELETHQMISVFGMFMTKTEFALLAFLNK